MAVVQLSKGNFQKEVLEDKSVVFVDFYAEWCGPCRITASVIDELAEGEEYKNKVKFVKVDVDSHQELAGKYNIFSVPTFIIFKNGKPAHQFSGAMGKEGFINEIKKVIGNS